MQILAVLVGVMYGFKNIGLIIYDRIRTRLTDSCDRCDSFLHKPLIIDFFVLIISNFYLTQLHLSHLCKLNLRAAYQKNYAINCSL